MLRGKTVISAFLILSYAIGMAHNVVPHCHAPHEDPAARDCSFHQHHEASNPDIDHGDHEHFLHDQHYDEGFYDFLVCFLNELEGPDGACDICHFFPPKTDKLSKLSPRLVQPPRLTIFGPASEILPASFFLTNEIPPAVYHPLGDSPHRGPPVLHG